MRVADDQETETPFRYYIIKQHATSLKGTLIAYSHEYTIARDASDRTDIGTTK